MNFRWALPLVLAMTLCVPAVSGQERVVLVQSCDIKKAATAPGARFMLGAEGTATDRANGLVWMRCALGQTWSGGTCAGTFTRNSWAGAFDAVSEFNRKGGFAGHADWRIPTLDELASIVEQRCYDPAIDLDVFPMTPITGYWSSSPHPSYGAGAMLVHFKYGGQYMGNKFQDWALRLVRGSGHNP